MGVFALVWLLLKLLIALYIAGVIIHVIMAIAIFSWELLEDALNLLPWRKQRYRWPVPDDTKDKRSCSDPALDHRHGLRHQSSNCNAALGPVPEHDEERDALMRQARRELDSWRDEDSWSDE